MKNLKTYDTKGHSEQEKQKGNKMISPHQNQNCKDAKIIATEYKIISLFNAFKIIIFKRTNRF